MAPSVLGLVLSADRRNMRTPEKLSASIRSGVSSRPVLNELPVEEDVEPLLVTNAAGQFVPTRRSASRGVARYGFSELPLEEEGRLLSELYMTLLNISWAQKWGNRCNSIPEAINRLREQSLEPSHLIVPEAIIPDICGPDYDPAWTEQLMMRQGFITVVDEMKVVAADLSDGAALVIASPGVSGLYTRVGDYLGVMVQRADRAWMVVGDGVA